ncbi:MAG: hypothetical protein HQ472_00675 [Ignavibacteria bacterium]|nr:hypothetical protein [Ignavibacteria bacterium]
MRKHMPHVLLFPVFILGVFSCFSADGEFVEIEKARTYFLPWQGNVSGVHYNSTTKTTIAVLQTGMKISKNDETGDTDFKLDFIPEHVYSSIDEVSEAIVYCTEAGWIYKFEPGLGSTRLNNLPFENVRSISVRRGILYVLHDSISVLSEGAWRTIVDVPYSSDVQYKFSDSVLTLFNKVMGYFVSLSDFRVESVTLPSLNLSIVGSTDSEIFTFSDSLLIVCKREMAFDTINIGLQASVAVNRIGNYLVMLLQGKPSGLVRKVSYNTNDRSITILGANIISDGTIQTYQKDSVAIVFGGLGYVETMSLRSDGKWSTSIGVVSEACIVHCFLPHPSSDSINVVIQTQPHSYSGLSPASLVVTVGTIPLSGGVVSPISVLQLDDDESLQNGMHACDGKLLIGTTKRIYSVSQSGTSVLLESKSPILSVVVMNDTLWYSNLEGVWQMKIGEQPSNIIQYSGDSFYSYDLYRASGCLNFIQSKFASPPIRRLVRNCNGVSTRVDTEDVIEATGQLSVRDSTFVLRKSWLTGIVDSTLLMICTIAENKLIVHNEALFEGSPLPMFSEYTHGLCTILRTLIIGIIDTRSLELLQYARRNSIEPTYSFVAISQLGDETFILASSDHNIVRVRIAGTTDVKQYPRSSPSEKIELRSNNWVLSAHGLSFEDACTIYEFSTDGRMISSRSLQSASSERLSVEAGNYVYGATRHRTTPLYLVGSGGQLLELK